MFFFRLCTRIRMFPLLFWSTPVKLYGAAGSTEVVGPQSIMKQTEAQFGSTTCSCIVSGLPCTDEKQNASSWEMSAATHLCHHFYFHDL